jgi:hypothetical protein
MLGLDPGKGSRPGGALGRLLRGLLIRLVPRSVPIIDRLAPSPVSMNRFLSYREFISRRLTAHPFRWPAPLFRKRAINST